MALKTMPIAKLQALKSQVEAAISAKVTERRRELESELSKLGGISGGGKRGKPAGHGRMGGGGSKIPQPGEPNRDLGRPWPQATLAGCCDQRRQETGRLFDSGSCCESLGGPADQENPEDAQGQQIGWPGPGRSADLFRHRVRHSPFTNPPSRPWLPARRPPAWSASSEWLSR
jgi:hypothetical protein